VRAFFRNIVLLSILLESCIPAYGQTAKKVLNASRTDEQIVIDGKLDEASWLSADVAADFVQYAPIPGAPSMQRTEVKVLYSNDAVYVGAMMYDSPDSIWKELSARDDDGGNTDEFGVVFDTYNDQQNGTAFSVTAAGVQVDAIYKFDGSNRSWNAAWYSKVAINDKGWCVEMKIPYSAIRFSKKADQVWGVNFFRGIKRYKEQAYWSTVLPTVANPLNQAGTLTGIHNIISPIRLSLLPYVSAYAQNYAGSNTFTLNGGMDIKYGLNESFTLDVTLVPDFGQTIYDNQVLNLSPIEVRYNENRYFFTEGLDLFNKNDLFYSRRVGGTPVKYGNVPLNAGEFITQNPLTTKLYNAMKISGRTKHNLGIGFFNAVTAPAYATIEDTANQKETFRKYQTAPLTNYNVVVLDQALKNNSYISFINTNVYRQQNSYNADVAALLFKFANKPNSYGINGSGDVSQRYDTSRPDIGYRYYFSGGKLSGNYTWTLSTQSISDHFNPNDLGYLDRNNITWYAWDQYYNIYKPVGPLVSAYNHVGINYYRIFNPDVYNEATVFGSHDVTFHNYLTVGAYWTVQPFTGYDFWEPRTFGRYYQYPKNYMVGGYYSSDYRRKFALDLQYTGRWFAERNRNTQSWSVSPRYRFSNKFSMIYSLSGSMAWDDVGFVENRPDSIIFGVRNVKTISNSLSAAYIFTNIMSVKLDARHYWSQADYNNRYEFLQLDGTTINAPSYTTNRNVNFNTFNVFMSFVWQFRPGSEMAVVYQNSIYSSPYQLATSYFTDLNNTLQAPQTNSLSIKIIYYIDYLNIRKALRGNS
jgi:hypothetical protein